MVGTFVALLIFIPVDVFRLHLLAKPSDLVSSLATSFFIAGWLLAHLRMRENAFAAPVVK